MAQKDLQRRKKKRWFTILSTSYFNNTEIGQTTVAESSSLIGKNVCISLMNLTQDIKAQNTKITFKIKEVKDEKALTELVKYEIVPSSLKRMVHKDKEKIDDSFKLKTKDNIDIKIKPFLVTKSSTKRSVLTSLRKKTIELLTNSIKNTTYEGVLENIIRFKIQSTLRKELTKVYPLSHFHIRKLEKLSS
ncbi:MAG: hypothetical protein CMH62_02745 [Nanoarchaeota archaeon]|nr:hypothetical protein [Nanoarchaeota archaeon]|tara:strand:- start:283 stop:852 length:570 start_codon:yes stop_codon:yes gene_type:complete